MLVASLMILVTAGGLMLELPRRRLLGLLAGIWLGAFALTLVLPDALALRVLGWDWRSMLIGTAAGGLVWGYRRVLLAARRRSGVETLRHEAETARAQGAALQAGIAADRARARADAATAKWPGAAAPAVPAAVPAGAHPAAAAADAAARLSGTLTDAELDRYARHIVLREIGGTGQRALRQARVLIVGAGGLGAPVCLYLAGAGVGRITLADDDRVSLSNLHRQVIFTTADAAAGLPKPEVAARVMAALNPHVAVTPLLRRITDADAELVAAHDLVIDGTDSFAVRAGVNRVCVAAGVPLLAGAIGQWDGQVTLYDPARGAPCMACVFPRAPAPDTAPDCATGGVAGPLPGLIGGLMALEAVKTLTGAGRDLRGRMLLWDGLDASPRSITIRRDPACPVCAGR